MLRRNLIECGIFVEEDARISISSPNADFDPERDIKRIFGTGGKIDQIYLLGRIHLDTTVRVENGVLLDGRGKNGVVLRGNTKVGKGTHLKDVIAVDTTFEGDETLDGFGFYPPRFDKPARIEESCFYKAYVGKNAEVKRTTAENCNVTGKALDDDM
jgi:hypothetical protein